MAREKIIMYLVKLIKAGRKTIDNVAPQYKAEVEKALEAN